MLPARAFEDRVAVVTGGSSGIGLAIARELARLEATIILLGRRESPLAEAAAQIEAAGGRAATFAADVRDRARVDEVVAEVVKQHGRIDHLVNSAAGNFQCRPEELTPNGWNAVVDIVLNGTWNMTQAVGRHMIENGRGGSILSIGTTAAMIGGPTTVHSSSAKAGVLSLTRSLAVAWAEHGVRLNVMTPGPTEDTGAMTFLYGEEGQWDAQVAAIPLARMLTQQEAADASAFLLSDFAGYVTGHNLVVDGGRSLGRAGGVFHGG
ncbi:MAG: SDR family oxidoreductase [Actinobacteria bacterium]|nr:SDR family oxidoreductase [Actinomycetota bacterium]